VRITTREELLTRAPHHLARADVAGSLLPIAGHGGSEDVVEHSDEGGGEAAAHLAVTAYHGGQVRHLDGERGVESHGIEHRGLPAVDERELALRSERGGAKETETAERPHPCIAQHRGGAHVLADGRAPFGPARLAPARDGGADGQRKNAVDLVEIGLEIVGDAEHLIVAGPVLAADPLEAPRTGLEIGDADRVLVAHPHREPSRETLGHHALRIGRAHSTHALQEALDVGHVLIVDEPRDRFAHHGVKRRGKLGLDAVQELDEGGAASAQLAGALRPGR
jgi:hypothetical protein